MNSTGNQKPSGRKNCDIIKQNPKYYAGLVEEALFEYDLDLNLRAKVTDVKFHVGTASCIVDCARAPSSAQIKSLLDEVRESIGKKCRISVFQKRHIRIVIPR